ncbi:MAG: tetratricopeptide repeat protein, partial [Terriglobales bacterium]
AMVAFLRGDLASQRHQFRQAEQQLQAALRLDPNDALALNDLGYLWAEHHVHLHAALKDVRQAVSAEPANGAYLDSLGWVYLQLGQLPAAVAQLQRAARLEPDDPTIIGHLATAYQRTGQLGKAEASWRQALANWQSSAPADHDAKAVKRDRKALALVEKQLAAH